MLELGVTPSHVSIAVGDDEISEETPDSAGCDDDVERSTHCIPLESIGLGGNQITCAGATMLASGLKTNTRELSPTRSLCQHSLLSAMISSCCTQLASECCLNQQLGDTALHYIVPTFLLS